MSIENNKDVLPLIEKAITERVILSLSYISAANGNRSDREVEPLALCFTQDRWMMIAYCRLRQSKREFRIDYIAELKETQTTFAPNQFTLSDYFKEE